MSSNWWDWLGDGIYFYQDALRWTRHWAINERHEGCISSPVIYAADIFYDGFFDLVEHDSLMELKRFFDHLEATAKNDFANAKAKAAKYKTDQEEWKARPHPLDRYVINEAAIAAEKKGVPFRAVRAVFFDGKPLNSDSGLYDRQHIQIAVRDPTLIKKWWRLPSG